VRRIGRHIRVIARLISAADGYHLWSERYDRELDDVFAVQDEIASAIGRALQAELAVKPRGIRAYVPSVPAWEALAKGRHLLFKSTPDSVEHAKTYFERAIALDPKYAEPHARLGQLYVFLALSGVRSPNEMMPQVSAEARKALSLFPSDPQAHDLLGIVAATYDYDWKQAQYHFQRAIAADSVQPEAHALYAIYELVPRGCFQAAIEEMEKVLEQDPVSVLFRSYLAFVLDAAGMHEEVLTEAHKALEID
jgi:tetratricopeptide (TPR) repeat protein